MACAGEPSDAQMLPVHEPSAVAAAEGLLEKDHDEPSSSTRTVTAGAPPPSNPRDKIRCLDGLRGIACLLVYNYHFFWPWTPAIMLGHGAAPPGSLEPFESWLSMPIVCLLHRGRPMVAIFFAISGYVVCRHILRAIHERRIEAAYKSLASASLRRAFRLYIPPTISMLLVAILAQAGAFRSEDDIYKGPDSAYINGTVALTKLPGHFRCPRGIPVVKGAVGMADYLGLDNTDYLYNLTGWEDRVCVNATSQLFSPASVYDGLVGPANSAIGRMSNLTHGLATYSLQRYVNGGVHDYDHLAQPYAGPVPVRVLGANQTTNVTDFKFVQLGGSWEEHPFIHDNATYALRNFTRAYAEWVNPFNFGHYHTRYDPHTFTIPMEFRGSLVLYVFLLATATIKVSWRLGLATGLASYSLHFGRWDIAAFVGGMAMSEVDIRSGARAGHPRLLMTPTASPNPSPTRFRGAGSAKFDFAGIVTKLASVLSISSHGKPPGEARRRATALRWLLTVVALHFLSYPDSSAEYTPGYKLLSRLVPRYYLPMSAWMYYQSAGAVLLLPCLMREPIICRALESRVPQYLGRISFSLYLVHGPILHSLGFWLMPRLFDVFGHGAVAYAVGWAGMLALTLYLSNLWHRHVDTWSMGVGRRVEKYLLED